MRCRTGIVRDSLGLPVTGASVLLTPGGSIYRTDSAGKFSARKIAPGPTTIAVRKLGFSPLQSQVSLPIGVDLTLDLVMRRLPQRSAEVEVQGTATYVLKLFSASGAQVGETVLTVTQDVGDSPPGTPGYFVISATDLSKRAKSFTLTNIFVRTVSGPPTQTLIPYGVNSITYTY